MPLAVLLPKAAGSVNLHSPSMTQRLPSTDRHKHAQLDHRRITSLNLRQEDKQSTATCFHGSHVRSWRGVPVVRSLKWELEAAQLAAQALVLVDLMAALAASGPDSGPAPALAASSC